MAKKNNATCAICGNEYHVCLSCQDSIKLNPWKIHCCSSSHYKVYQAVHGYTTGVYTKKEFKNKLSKIDLHDLDSYIDSIKTIIKDVLKEEEIVAEKKVESEIKAENANVGFGVEKVKSTHKKSQKVEE